MLLPLAHFLLLAVQYLSLGRQGIQLLSQGVPFFPCLVSLGTGLFPVGCDFFQIFKVRCQRLGASDTLQVFLCPFHFFLLGRELLHLGLCFFQHPEMVGRYRRVLVDVPERPILLVQPFLFLSPFLKEMGGVLYILCEFLFIGHMDHGKCGSQLRLFCSIGLCQFIHGHTQFILEIGEPLGLEELLQDGLPVLRFRHQELPEIPLGQQDDLAELLGIETDKLSRRLFDAGTEGPHFFPILQF